MTELEEPLEGWVIVNRKGVIPFYWSWGSPGHWTEDFQEARQYSREGNARIAINNMSAKAGVHPEDVTIERIA